MAIALRSILFIKTVDQRKRKLSYRLFLDQHLVSISYSIGSEKLHEKWNNRTGKRNQKHYYVC